MKSASEMQLPCTIPRSMPVDRLPRIGQSTYFSLSHAFVIIDTKCTVASALKSTVYAHSKASLEAAAKCKLETTNAPQHIGGRAHASLISMQV